MAHVIAAIFSIGAHHADEIYQIFEFAGYKLGINTAAELPWEFHERMRSGLQPLIVFGFTRLLNFFSVFNPFVLATLLRLLHGLLGFHISLRLMRLLDKEFKLEAYRQTFVYINLLFWLLPYFHVRFSSESFSTVLFLGAFIIIRGGTNKLGWVRFPVSGILAGLAFEARFQMSFMIAGYFLWMLFIERQSLIKMVSFLVGICTAIALGCLIDFWLYGEWTLSWWQYLEQNLFEGKASHFGKEPLYYFFTEGILQLIPPFSLVLIGSIVLFWWRFPRHVITWMTLPFVLLHLPVAHKEIRFLMPLLAFMPFMVIYYFESLSETEHLVLKFIRSPGFLRFAVIFNTLALLFICLKPADSSTQRLEKIYTHAEGDSALLLFDKDNPYELGSLHYFRKASVRTDYIPADLSALQRQNLYLFSESDQQPLYKIIGDRVFYKVYCNFPDWFNYLNFNGWVERAGRYSIYKYSDA